MFGDSEELYTAPANARQRYISYLSTNALAAAVDNCEQKLRPVRCGVVVHNRELLMHIHKDLLAELAARQMELHL